jgi:hypothetical protein
MFEELEKGTNDEVKGSHARPLQQALEHPDGARHKPQPHQNQFINQ